jgi:hypothetical protein
MRTARRFLIAPMTLLVLAAPAFAKTAASISHTPVDFTGVLVTGGGASTVPITLHVDSYTTTDEVRSLARVLGDKGQHAVVATLAEMKPRGWIRVGDMIGSVVPVIRSFDSDKGTRIFAVLDRPLPIFQQLQGTHSPDYPYGMVELKLNVDGNGQGTLVAAGRSIFADDGQILMESYGTKPYQIIGVTQQPVGK